MRIAGLQKTTLLDYPGHVAATIFLAGCNMRCPFCHNMNLVLGADDGSTDINADLYGEAELLEFLNKRRGILDGVCITGGEPTLNPELPDFIRSIKAMGLKVKLDTNGSNPTMLKSLIDERLVDYVAMDIKTSLEYGSSSPGEVGVNHNKKPDYPNVCGNEHINLKAIKESIDILLSLSTDREEGQEIDYEFRTTVIKEYHDTKVFETIGQMLEGAKNYYLQSFVDSEYVADHSLSSYDKEELESFVQIMRRYVINADIRGV